MNLTGTIKIKGSQTLYPLAAKWAGAFMKDHPKVKIEVSSQASQWALADLLAGKTDMAMVSCKPTDEEMKQGLWVAPVALDALVAIINFDNSEIQPLVMHGIKREMLTQIYQGSVKTWGAVTGRNAPEPVKVYALSDSTGTARTWNQFLGLAEGQHKATRLQSPEQMLAHVRLEKGAIGYCSIMDAYNMQTGFRKDGLYIVPVDYNANGHIEDAEQFYDKFTLISSALIAGKVPRPPARELFLVTKGKPSTEVMQKFLDWVLTIGQNYAATTGFVNLSKAQAEKTRGTIK